MSSNHGSTAAQDAGHHGVGHIVPTGLLLAIACVLLVLTVVTVAVTWVDLGPLNLWIALLIAVVKAALVVLYFMHLRYDAPFNGIILVASLVFVMLFVGLALTDTKAYQPQLVGGPAPAMATTRQ
ncbi:MAG: cytochrome C oxidase subunit IV family protein [Phycisphaerae bacterium]